MRAQDDDKPYDDINITPMLDLAYVLLVIFIIMTTASVQGIKVNLPKASAAVSMAKPQTKAITISESGQVFLDAYPVTLTELEQRLRSLKALNPDFPVVVKGEFHRAVPESHGHPGSAASRGPAAGWPRDRQGAEGLMAWTLLNHAAVRRAAG
jgi:outer membrane transport energization protein ExbD (TC 2.C.1.1.1)